MIGSRRTTAGRSAHQIFRGAERAWHRRVVRRVQPFLLVPAVALYVVQVVWAQHLLSWSLGLAAGGLVALWAWLRDSPPAHIEQWRTGRDAERRTAKALRPLVRAGWAVAHDVGSEYGNRDHVLVGPGGVFLVDTKELSGVASVHGDAVRVERPDNPRGTYELRRLAGSVRRAAADLSRELQALTGERVWVHGAVVFWNEFPAGAVEADRVAFVDAHRAAAWFERQPRRLSPAQVDRVGAAVAALPRAAA